MTAFLHFEILDLEIWVILLMVLVAFLAGAISGSIGVGGGLIMAAVFSHFLGIKETVTVVSCSLTISHATRGIMFRKDIQWWVALRVLLFGTPTIILGTIIFGYLSKTFVAIVFGTILLLSIPIKRWSKRNELKTSPRLLSIASSFWGMLAGNVIGPAFFLTPFILGLGLNRFAFVGTIAIISLVMNLIKISVLSFTDLVSFNLVVLGLISGIASIPGNMLGRAILKRINDGVHQLLIDFITLILVANFFYLAIFKY